MVEILIFAILSIYLFTRLWNVLGSRTGQEKNSNFSLFTKSADVVPKKDIQDVEVEIISPLEYEEQRLSAIDPNFSFDKFLKGAKNAFAHIIQSYSKGDEHGLKKLMNDKVFKQFRSAIKQHEKSGTILNIEVLELEAEVYSVQLESNIAFITIRFNSNQVTSSQSKDKERKESKAEQIIDIWKFSKDLTDSNPNWQLIETL